MFDLKKLYTGNLEWLADHTILFGLAGSKSYGLDTPESDTDLKGLCIPPVNYFYGWLNNFEQAERKKQDDDIEFTIYDIRKFFNLAANNNPGLLELLFLDPADYLIMTELGEQLINNRDKFLSRKVVYTYSGYSASQLKKIKTHRSHLLSPPTHEPTREEFGLPRDKAFLSKDQQGAYDELVSSGKLSENDVGSNFLEALAKEKAYFQARRSWDRYQEWKINRNPTRAKMEAEFGYDLKFAVHLVRLLIQAKEILTTGKLIVKRPDRDFLLSIRNGAWTYDQLIEWSSEQEAEIMKLAETSILPHSPDRVFLDQLCVDMVEQFMRSK